MEALKAILLLFMVVISFELAYSNTQLTDVTRILGNDLAQYIDENDRLKSELEIAQIELDDLTQELQDTKLNNALEELKILKGE